MNLDDLFFVAIPYSFDPGRWPPAFCNFRKDEDLKSHAIAKLWWPHFEQPIIIRIFHSQPITLHHVLSGRRSPDFPYEVKPSLPLGDGSLKPPTSTTASAAAGETLSDTRRKLFRPYCLDDPPVADQKPPLAAYIAPSGWWVPPHGRYSPLDLSSKVLASSPPPLEFKEGNASLKCCICNSLAKLSNVSKERILECQLPF